jgi:tRNA G10  N-methylase Trm11
VRESVQLKFFAEEKTEDDWTFNGASVRELTHCYHDYPARMIPQIAGKLLDTFATNKDSVLFDPYCGTGTSLVEGFIRGFNVIGTDLNPLARLIAKTKTSTPDLKKLEKEIVRLNKQAVTTCAYGQGSNVSTACDSGRVSLVTEIKGITKLDFWFKKEVIEKLFALKNFIEEIEDDAIQSFFKVAFSETVRESSNTRNSEFKLYRYAPEQLEKFSPDVFGIIASKLERNRVGLKKFLEIVSKLKSRPSSNVFDFNTVVDIPKNIIAPKSVDIVITSPPYGDSHTTVAYGQYSRLSAAWLDLHEPDKIDKKLMGSFVSKERRTFECDELNKALMQIQKEHPKRALEVAAFYDDLRKSISHIAPTVKSKGYACYVVGNRKVKGIVLPTDLAVQSFFESQGFKHINTFHRRIPNKRMPLRNSPSNISGAVDNTMLREHIVVMKKIENAEACTE